MSLSVTEDEFMRMVKKLDYKGCRNCTQQLEPMRMCEWAEHGGDGQIHLICPRWEKKENK